MRSDGLTKKDAARFRVQAIEQKLLKAKGREKKKLEEMHEEAMEAMMDCLMDGGEGDDDFADIGLGVEEEGEDDDDEEEGEGSVVSGKGKQPAAAQSEGEEEQEPSSFSRIPTAILHKHLNLPTTAALRTSTIDVFDLDKPAAPFVVHLKPGEMLYLPASWWHEVTSSSSDEPTHMAFNYWFYPPDGLKKFEEPYEDALVWGYLRDQLKAADKKSGKRKRDNGSGGSSKKSKK